MSLGLAIEFLDQEALDSLQRLPARHRDIAWNLLDHLRDNPTFGAPLRVDPAAGLPQTRVFYVVASEQERRNWPPPYRVAYRLLPSEEAVERVQVIWAGSDDDPAIYQVAAQRLRR